MALIKAYINGIQERYGEMMNEFGLTLNEVGVDVYGAFMMLESPNGHIAHKIGDYKGIDLVHEIEEIPSREFFKAYIKTGKTVDLESMGKEFGLKIRELGNEKSGRKIIPYMIIEGDNNVYPEQIEKYDFISKVKMSVNFKPVGETGMSTKSIIPEDVA